MKVLTTTQAAARLGVSVLRVQQFIWQKRLPAEKVGRDWTIKEDDLRLVAVRPTGRPKGSGKAKPEAASA